MSLEAATECRHCGEEFGNPGARSTHEDHCLEDREHIGPEPSSPPFWRCTECGVAIAYEPVPESAAYRANHAKEHLEPGADSRGLYEWVSPEDRGEISDQELAAALEDA